LPDNPHGRRFKASEGTRTPDPLITNQPLYLLSYAGVPSLEIIQSCVVTGKYKRSSEKLKKFLLELEVVLFQRVILK
jgi:hypothetical protein